MRILWYQTKHRAENRILRALRECGHVVETFFCPLQTGEQEEQFLPLIREACREQRADVIFSIGYFAAISDACEQENRLYLAYCCDVPTLAMYERNIANPCNRILVADRDKIAEFTDKGAAEVYYVPMAPLADISRIRMADNASGGGYTEYRRGEPGARRHISFVGSLHENNLYRSLEKLPDSMRGYLDGIMVAQSRIYGYTMYRDVLDESFWDIMAKLIRTPQAGDDREKLCYMLEHFFFAPQVTRLERMHLVGQLAARVGEQFGMYGRECPENAEKFRYHGELHEGAELAGHYHGTEINVNITNRARTGGVPQKVWDVLACGGFLLSNYQADFEGLLVPGEDFVMYGSADELTELAEYYLEHPIERQELAQNGQRKVTENHTWEQRIEMLLGRGK